MVTPAGTWDSCEGTVLGSRSRAAAAAVCWETKPCANLSHPYRWERERPRKRMHRHLPLGCCFHLHPGGHFCSSRRHFLLPQLLCPSRPSSPLSPLPSPCQGESLHRVPVLPCHPLAHPRPKPQNPPTHPCTGSLVSRLDLRLAFPDQMLHLPPPIQGPMFPCVGEGGLEDDRDQ